MDTKWVVHKFGGTSVGSAACFAQVGDIVTALDAPRVAVVVSAIGGKPKVTDLLISLLELAKARDSHACDAILATIRAKHSAVITALLPPAIGAPIDAAIATDLARLSELLRAISIMRSFNDSVVEFISGHGEIWSAQILAAVLTQRAAAAGHDHVFHYVDARSFLIVEPDSDHGPVVQYATTRTNLHQIVANTTNATNATTTTTPKTHLVITGFICSTSESVMTTLKRDGSDFTASICGRVLDASSITIWTDVSGVLSSDPRRVPDAQILSEVSYEEAMELAYFGAKVIHPKTMTPAVAAGIPIFIRNTFDPTHPGTKIYNSKQVALERQVSNGGSRLTAKTIVSGFSTVDDLALFNIEGSGLVGVHGTSSRLFSALDRVKVNVVLIAQASSEHSICFAVPMHRALDVQAAVSATFFHEIHHGLVNEPAFIAPTSIIAAVGDNMSHTPGVCSRFFRALGRAQINVLAISQGSSERNISAVVRFEDSAAALQAVHASFFLADQTLAIGVIGFDRLVDGDGKTTTGQQVGLALLTQLEAQCAVLRDRFRVDIRVRAIATHATKQMLLDHSNAGLSVEAVQTARDDAFVPFDHATFLAHVCADHLPHWLVVDVSDCATHVESLYRTWLDAPSPSRQLHVITANINVALTQTHARHQQEEQKVDAEACLAIGVPVLETLQSFVQTGDVVERVEVTGSPLFTQIAHKAMRNRQSDGHNVAFAAVVAQQLEDEAVRTNMSVSDILDDLTGVRSAKKAVLLARALGFADKTLADVAVDSCWQHVAAVHEKEPLTHDAMVEQLVATCAPLQLQLTDALALAADVNVTPALRVVASIDAQSGAIAVRVVASPPAHAFATLQPSQCAFAFYTKRHAAHPVVVSGPIADSAITAGALFGSILNLARQCGSSSK